MSPYELAYRRRAAVEALKTLVRNWHFVPRGKVRKVIANMLADEPVFEEIDNKRTTPKSGGLAAVAAAPAARIEVAKQATPQPRQHRVKLDAADIKAFDDFWDLAEANAHDLV